MYNPQMHRVLVPVFKVMEKSCYKTSLGLLKTHVITLPTLRFQVTPTRYPE